jgi:hypothetical protein
MWASWLRVNRKPTCEVPNRTATAPKYGAARVGVTTSTSSGDAVRHWSSGKHCPTWWSACWEPGRGRAAGPSLDRNTRVTACGCGESWVNSWALRDSQLCHGQRRRLGPSGCWSSSHRQTPAITDVNCCRVNQRSAFWYSTRSDVAGCRRWPTGRADHCRVEASRVRVSFAATGCRCGVNLASSGAVRRG